MDENLPIQPMLPPVKEPEPVVPPDPEDEPENEEEEEQDNEFERDPANLPDLPPVRWTASEFISHQKTTVWYVGLGVIAAIMTVFVIVVTHSVISGLVVAFASVVVGIFAARKPETKQYEINDEGIRIGERSYSYDIFKSFSVVEEGAVNSIWLRPLKRLMPTIVMYFEFEDEDEIVDMLENFLPEEDRALDRIDQVSRRFRF